MLSFVADELKIIADALQIAADQYESEAKASADDNDLDAARTFDLQARRARAIVRRIDQA